MVIKNVLDMIGNTPLVDLSPTMGCQIYAKAEFLNLGGSIKDRVAKNMIEAAEKEGKLKKGMTIVEPTSGNTGIGLAFVAAVRGYKLILTMPDTMSIERRNIVRMLGAEDMRMAADQLIADLVHSFRWKKILVLLVDIEIHEDINHYVSDFLSFRFNILFQDSIKIFIAFIYKRNRCAFVCLYTIPWTSTRCSQYRYNCIKPVYS